MNRRIFLSWMGLGFLATGYPVIISALLAQGESQLTTQQESKLKSQPKLTSQPKRTNSETILFYVAPNGNDAWSGRFASPNARKTDGPFATLERARNTIRQLKQRQGTLKQPVTILIRGGHYFLSKPLVLTPMDSGTKDAPITYAAYQDEKPVISGGRRIQGWREERVNGRTMWTVTLPEVKAGNWYFQHLWVNGQRRNRARYPNKGYLQVEAVPDAGKFWTRGQNRFKFKNGDLQAWPSVDLGEAVVMTRWIESRLPIAEVDESERIISFSKKTLIRIDPNDLYYLENIFETLDTPGEWYLNQSTGKLYYIPMPGEQINTIEAIAPTLVFLLLLQGRPIQEQYVENINFEELTFSHNDWKLPPNISGFDQNAFGVPGAILGNGVKNCSWKKCIIAHIGSHAIELFRGCRNNTIVKCEMFDLGAGAVKLGERRTYRPDLSRPHLSDAQETNNNKVIENHIYNGGYFFPSAVAVRATHSNHNLIAHNHIHDFYYMGISVRGFFDYKPTRAHHNIIEFNHVHHIGKLSNGEGPLLDDKGGIYAMGVQPGTVIRSNTIHDIQATGFRGWGIYLDGNSSQIVVENNLVYRTTEAGIHLHYGKENIIRNNIFAFGRLAQIRRTRLEPHLSLTFERNIVYWREGKLLVGRLRDLNFAFDRNLYWYAGQNEDDDDKIKFANWSWQEWRAKGMDRNSIIADPMFVAPEKGDFRLRRNSPAFKLGFRPLPT
ncbi:MAG: right-handed parallel beta-helix repeat-containing protein [Prochloraceae cyanobacterium]|nr:right-handed parallel beta-helix repeat-containing protein [Prochloraceae cyanobacterium]